MGKDKLFEVGTYVFAKVRGYPAWPARIHSILDPKPASIKYEVFFFGTSETATVQAKEVFPFDEFKEKYGKPVKRKFFNEGMEELEADRKKKQTESNSDEPMITTDDRQSIDKDLNEEEKTEPRVGKRIRESIDDDGPETKIKRKASTESSKAKPADQEAKDKDDDRDAKKTTSETEISRKRKKSTVIESPEIGQSKEQTSRSGRVIKPKKFLYDEEEKDDSEGKQKSKPSSSPVPKENVENNKNDESPKKQRKSKGKPEKKLEESPPVLAKMGRIMWTRSKEGQLVQVKIDHDRPRFKNNKSRLEWEENYEKQLQLLQEKIATGAFVPEEVPAQLMPSSEIFNQMTSEEKLSVKKLRWLERKRGHYRLLNLESRIMDINMQLRTCLQKNKAELGNALDLMDELINIPMEALTLKKYPQLVETVKKIQNYIGNIPNWDLSESETAKFKQQAAELRQKATTALNKFQNLFGVGRSENFLNVFQESLKEFQALTKDMSTEKVLMLVADPSSPMFQEISIIVDEDDKFEKETVEPMAKLQE